MDTITEYEPVLRTGRWLLRPWAEDDGDGLYSAVAASLTELGRWLSWAHPAYSPVDASDWIAHCRRDWREGSGYPFGVFDALGGTVVGAAGISRLDRTNRCGNLGYWVASASTGQGVARAAAGAVADYAFRELGFWRLEIVALSDNLASRRVADALGAQWECTARDRVEHRGQPEAAEVYALLPRDLRAAAVS